MKVDIDALASELEMSFDELDMYLDLETGEVITVSDEEMRIAIASEEGEDFSSYSEWEKEAIEIALKIYVNSDRYKLLPKMSSHEAYEIMSDFCATVNAASVREKLFEALEGRGPFRKFKDMVLHFGIEQDWYAYRSEKIKAFAIKWCDENGVTYE